ncbi:MAG: hypothetical protein KF799_01780 [Bdellovibrionales bacterium]|nr:hypothetical protein [Bdellovibrionales bacterium]
MKILAFFLLIFSFAQVHALPFRGPMSSALGGTGVAGMDGAEASFLNPALIPLFQGSAIDGYYRDGYEAPGRHRQAWALGAIDNTRDVWFPGAIHYVRTRDTGRGLPAEGDLWHVSIAERFEQFTLGLSVYRLVYDVQNDREYTQWNGSVGGVYMIHDGLGVAYVLSNVAQPGSNVPKPLREDMRQTAGVFAKWGEIARVRFDLERQERFNPDHDMAYMFGLESKTSEMLILRLGYRYDDWANERIWTAGIGFDGPRLKLDYAIEKNQEGTPGALHSVDLRLVF